MDLGKLHLHWRVSQYQGNTYRSYSLARSLRQDGKKPEGNCSQARKAFRR